MKLSKFLVTIFIFLLASPVRAELPYYTLNLAKPATIDEDTVYASQVNIRPAPKIDSATKQKAGTFTIIGHPSKGIVRFKVSGTAVKADLTYQPFENVNGIDYFSFEYSEPANGTTPARTSSVIKVAVNIKPVNDAPIVIGPKSIGIQQLTDPTLDGEDRGTEVLFDTISLELLTLHL